MNDTTNTDREVYVHGTYTPYPAYWGMVPEFLNPDDPRPAWEQINEHYIGGWHPLKGFDLTLKDEYTMSFVFAGDPTEDSISWMRFRDEMLYINAHEFVALKKDGEWEAARLD